MIAVHGKTDGIWKGGYEYEGEAGEKIGLLRLPGRERNSSAKETLHVPPACIHSSKVFMAINRKAHVRFF